MRNVLLLLLFLTSCIKIENNAKTQNSYNDMRLNAYLTYNVSSQYLFINECLDEEKLVVKYSLKREETDAVLDTLIHSKQNYYVFDRDNAEKSAIIYVFVDVNQNGFPNDNIFENYKKCDIIYFSETYKSVRFTPYSGMSYDKYIE